MSLGASQEERALTRHLADTLVEQEVIQPMNAIQWGHGQPPPPVSGQPAATERAPASAPNPAPALQGGQPAPAATAQSAAAAPAKANAPEDLTSMFESLRDPKNGKIMGKYDNIEQALKGAGHLANMTKEAFAQRDAALAEAQRLREEGSVRQTQPAVVPSAAPSPAPAAASQAAVEKAQATYDAVLLEVSQSGGILDEESSQKFAKANRELAMAISKAAVEETLASREGAARAANDRWAAVDEYMSTKYPGSLDFSEEVGLFVQSDPLLKSAVNALVAQGKDQEATEFAWKEFSKVHTEIVASKDQAEAAKKEAELAAKEQVRKEVVDKARADAGIVHPSAGGSGVHQRPEAAAPTREEIARMGQAMVQQGSTPGSHSGAAWREAVIGRFLDPSIFGE